MIEVRFHGRGGQGAKLASRILGRAGFLSGLQVQDFALFGAERRGTPVVSFTRLSDEPIDQRGYVDQPNLVVVMDHSLLSEAQGQVFHGVHRATPLLVNAAPERFAATVNQLPEAIYHAVDLSEIARQWIGNAFVSAAAAAIAAKSIRAVTLKALEDAVRIEIAEFGLAAAEIAKNIAAARLAYERAPIIELAAPPPFERDREAIPDTPPYLATPQFAGPTIRRRGGAALRQTGNWRVERPVIELGKCKRCFLCYLYCPEAAMKLDAENFPHVDYDHCKGCMICYEECPTDAISRRLEV
jgi:pyruvate ferredoxin oxidoreductase gamma subunit